MLTLGPPPLTIAGRVVDAAGAPVPGAEVWTDEETHFGYIPLEGGELSVTVGASIEGLLRADPWTHRVRTDAAGRFALVGLLARDYRLRAFDPRRVALVTERVAAGTSDVELRFAAEDVHRVVAGRVIDLHGEPLAAMEVVLERPPLGGGPAGLLHGHAARTDAEGKFEFEQVSAAVSAVHVRGAEVGLEGFSRALGAEDDLEHLDVAVPLRVHVQIDAGEASGVQSASLLDASGEALTVSLYHGEHAYSLDVVPLTAGRSESFSVSQTAAMLVLFADGVEVRRLPVTLVRGRLNALRL